MSLKTIAVGSLLALSGMIFVDSAEAGHRHRHHGGYSSCNSCQPACAPAACCGTQTHAANYAPTAMNSR